jgi:hypothetical protein
MYALKISIIVLLIFISGVQGQVGDVVTDLKTAQYMYTLSYFCWETSSTGKDIIRFKQIAPFTAIMQNWTGTDYVDYPAVTLSFAYSPY